jgi:hypothetical protein
MPLLDLKTDLKSLKYGNDTLGGGDSGQPYIVTDINTADLRIPFDDGSIRYGIVGALEASETDRLRINKFLYSGVQGSLFIVKQIGLQLSNPRLEVPKNPRNIIQGIPENALSFATNGLLEPTRTYNGGVNTLAQIPATAFGRHFNRHGLLVEQSEASKYEAVATANNEVTISDSKGNNRLVSLKDKFNIGDIKLNSADPTQQLINRVNRTIAGITNVFNTISAPLGGPRIPKFSLTPEQLIIDQYLGGPDSVYGIIGQTTIRRSSNTEDGDKIKQSLDNSTNYAGQTRNDKGEPEPVNYTSGLGKGDKAISNYPDVNSGFDLSNSRGDKGTYTNINSNGLLKITVNNEDKITDLPVPEISPRPVKNSTYEKLNKVIESKKFRKYTYSIDNNEVNAFGLYGNDTNGTVGGGVGGEILPDILGSQYPIYSNGEKIIRIRKPWNEVSREKRISSGRQDGINLTPIFSGQLPLTDKDGNPVLDAKGNQKTINQGDRYFGNDSVKIEGKEYNIRDLVKFRIQAINTDSPNSGDWMVFRAYLTSFSDSVDSQWNDIKYTGRGNPFYIYTGFTRKIQVGFKAAALSAEEMRPMYQKLNYLMASLMPDYKNNIMRGPLHRLTVGNYIDSQLGKLDSVSYTIPNDSPWEIAIDEPEGGIQQLILPHIIEVQMSFTPIGAETNQNNLIEAKNDFTSFIAQNNTGADSNQIQYYRGFKS